MVLTGADGALEYKGQKCAKVRSWTLNISRDAIDDSCLGQFDRTYISGMRSATGSASLFYDPMDAQSRRMLNTIFENKAKARDVKLCSEYN